jgi:hypothetical protein
MGVRLILRVTSYGTSLEPLRSLSAPVGWNAVEGDLWSGWHCSDLPWCLPAPSWVDASSSSPGLCQWAPQKEFGLRYCQTPLSLKPQKQGSRINRTLADVL